MSVRLLRTFEPLKSISRYAVQLRVGFLLDNTSAYTDILEDMKQTARFLKTLADETRLRILALLTSDELCVCDLMAALELPQSTVSRHLATLRNAGLVEDRRQGVWMYYRLAGGETQLAGLIPFLQAQLVELPEARHDLLVLQAYLKQKDPAACR